MTGSRGSVVIRANNAIQFTVSGPGEIVATDNGDPADLVLFPSTERKAFSGLALVIARAKAGQPGQITVTARSDGLRASQLIITITASGKPAN
ncbi:hypothetical protein [Spirosoma fluminis]